MHVQLDSRTYICIGTTCIFICCICCGYTSWLGDACWHLKVLLAAAHHARMHGLQGPVYLSQPPRMWQEASGGRD